MITGMKRFVLIVLAAALPLSAASVAGATTKKVNPHATYALGKAKKCRTDFVKKTERHTVVVKVKGKNVRKSERYVACTYVTPKVAVVPAPIAPTVIPTPTTTAPAPAPAAPTPAPAPTPPAPSYSYEAHVDPTFVQSSTNALDVTYSFSADASETQGSNFTDLAQVNQLPNGVLDFYSNGSLACSLNVGGPQSSGTCDVVYPTPGDQTVVTEYIPNGIDPVSQTDIEDIALFAPTLTLTNSTCTPLILEDECAWNPSVTVTGLTPGQPPTGATVSIAGVPLHDGSCAPIVYNPTTNTATTSCTENVAESGSVSSLTPIVTFSGDVVYPSVTIDGAPVVIPAS